MIKFQDICLRQKDCSPSKVGPALTYISYIGIIISIVCLILTLITLVIFKYVDIVAQLSFIFISHILFRDVRQKDVSKFHIQLSIAILLMLVVALVLVSVRGEIYGSCVTVSVLLHYITLVAVMWMGAEALLMFQKLVIVFVNITTKYIVIVSVICWCKCYQF